MNQRLLRPERSALARLSYTPIRLSVVGKAQTILIASTEIPGEQTPRYS